MRFVGQGTELRANRQRCDRRLEDGVRVPVDAQHAPEGSSGEPAQIARDALRELGVVMARAAHERRVAAAVEQGAQREQPVARAGEVAEALAEARRVALPVYDRERRVLELPQR